MTPSASCSWDRYSVLKRDDRAALGGVLDQHRLHQRLRDVQHRARAALQVVADPMVSGAPRLQPHDLLAGQARGEQGVAHLVPRGGVLAGLVLDAEVAQHLHRALVGDVRAGRVRHPREHRHRVHPNPVGRQRERRGATRRAEADHDDVGVVAVHRRERHEGQAVEASSCPCGLPSCCAERNSAERSTRADNTSLSSPRGDVSVEQMSPGVRSSNAMPGVWLDRGHRTQSSCRDPARPDSDHKPLLPVSASPEEG